MAVTSLEKKDVENFYFQLMESDYNEVDGADYFPQGQRFHFKGTFAQAEEMAEIFFRWEHGNYSCGVYIFVWRNGAWQEIAATFIC